MPLIDINWNPGPGRLRLFAAALPLPALLAGWLIETRFAVPWLAVGLVGCAVAVSLMGLIRPAWFRPVYVAWMVLGLPVGWLVSHVVLLVIFFGVLTPLGWLLRRCGYDPLRRVDKPIASFWTARESAADHRRYFRPY